MTTQEKVLKVRHDTKLSYKKMAALFSINQTTLMSWSKGGIPMENVLNRFNKTYAAWERGELADAIYVLNIPRDVSQPSHFAIFESIEKEDEAVCNQLVEIIEAMEVPRYPRYGDFVKHNKITLHAQIVSKASHEYYRDMLFPRHQEPTKRQKTAPRHKLLIGTESRLQGRLRAYGDRAVVVCEMR